MGITRVDQVQAASSATESARSLVLPALAADDFVVIGVCIVSASAPTVSLPSGWNNDLALVRAGTSTMRMGIWSKKAVSGDSGATINVSSTAAGQFGLIGRVYRGVDTSTPYDVAIASANSGTSATAVPCPSLTPVTDGALIVALYGVPTTANTNWTDWTAPAGLGGVKNACSTVASTNNAAVGTSDLLQATAAATGVMTATTGPAASPQSRPWTAISLALRPAGAAPSPPGNGLWGVHL